LCCKLFYSFSLILSFQWNQLALPSSRLI